jgi:hypothetical protein
MYTHKAQAFNGSDASCFTAWLSHHYAHSTSSRLICVKRFHFSVTMESTTEPTEMPVLTFYAARGSNHSASERVDPPIRPVTLLIVVSIKQRDKQILPHILATRAWVALSVIHISSH